MYIPGNHTLEGDRLKLTRRMEEALSEADWRSINDKWDSESCRFALQMRETIKDMLEFLDDYEEELKEMVRNHERECSDLQSQIDEDEETLSKIKDLASGRDPW